jgi:hypothetical protein
LFTWTSTAARRRVWGLWLRVEHELVFKPELIFRVCVLLNSLGLWRAAITKLAAPEHGWPM